MIDGKFYLGDDDLDPDYSKVEKVFLSHDEFKHESWYVLKDFYDLAKCQSQVKRLMKGRIVIKPPEGTLAVIQEDIKDVEAATMDEIFRKNLVNKKIELVNKCESFCKLKNSCPKFMSASNIIKAFKIYE